MWEYKVLQKALGRTPELRILDYLFRYQCRCTYKIISRDLRISVQKISAIVRKWSWTHMVKREKIDNEMCLSLIPNAITRSIDRVRTEHIKNEHIKMTKFLQEMGLTEEDWKDVDIED